jgi:endo-1,4-beta-xylanase
LLTIVNRRAFLRTGAACTAILLGAPAWCAESEKPALTDEELLSEARSSIEEHRKTDVTIRVEDTNGKPLPGAKLTIEQLQHEFLFGCNLFLFAHCADPDQEQEYRRRFASLFNYCTLGFYWASYEFQRGKPDYDYTDQVLQWTREQGIASKGHPLVWDHPAGSPRWLPDSQQEIAPLVAGHIKEIVSRFRGRIDIWDVVNEATHLPDGVNKTKMAAWGAGIGPVAYTLEPLRIARAANPDATLLVNDYRTDPPYFHLLDLLRDHGPLLPSTIGIQSHMHQGVWPASKVHSVCRTYARLGLPIHFTETTILSGQWDKKQDAWGPTSSEGEAAQAQRAIDFYTILFSHPSVQALSWWDLSDYHAWQHAPAGLLRADMSPKPAYERLFKLIKERWWTKVQDATDIQGRFAWRGFYGRHRVTAQGPGNRKAVEELVLQRSKPNQFTIRIQS